MNEFTGRTVIITGAAGNLGRATADAFARRGARLALVDLDLDALRSAQEAIPEGSDSAVFATDLMDPSAVSKMADGIKAR
ncbi:MAG: SDR family NAD(P)-dependent oxidoreductase, partial [Thiocapsa sp.]